MSSTKQIKLRQLIGAPKKQRQKMQDPNQGSLLDQETPTPAAAPTSQPALASTSVETSYRISEVPMEDHAGPALAKLSNRKPPKPASDALKRQRALASAMRVVSGASGSAASGAHQLETYLRTSALDLDDPRVVEIKTAAAEIREWQRRGAAVLRSVQFAMQICKQLNEADRAAEKEEKKVRK